MGTFPCKLPLSVKPDTSSLPWTQEIQQTPAQPLYSERWSSGPWLYHQALFDLVQASSIPNTVENPNFVSSMVTRDNVKCIHRMALGSEAQCKRSVTRGCYKWWLPGKKTASNLPNTYTGPALILNHPVIYSFIHFPIHYKCSKTLTCP